MASKFQPPSSSAAPISKEVVEIVKKKIGAPPMSPPPSSVRQFTTPKSYHDDNDGDIKSFRSESKSEASDDEDNDDRKAQSKQNRKSFNKTSEARHLTFLLQDVDDNDLDNNGKYKNGKPPLSPMDRGRKNKSSNNDDDSSQKSKGKSKSRSASESRTELSTTANSGIFDFYKFLKSAKNRKLKSFLLSPVEHDVTVRCYIERDRNGSNMLGHVYTLCADLEDGSGQELMTCKKIMLSRTAHYVFSILSSDLTKKREDRSKLYLGKLRAGSSHGEYILYDQGMHQNQQQRTTISRSDSYNERDSRNDSNYDNGEAGPIKQKKQATNGVATPKSTRSSVYGGERFNDSEYEDEDVEKTYNTSNQPINDKIESASIRFNCLYRPAPNGMRGLEVAIPHPTEPFNTHSSLSLSEKFSRITSKGKQNELLSDECVILHERKTKYDPLSSCLVDYSGRANIASIKNFQLMISKPMSDGGDEYAEKAEDFILQLGKTTEDCFNMDLKYPLTPFQAFAVCIARFDCKLSWKDL